MHTRWTYWLLPVAMWLVMVAFGVAVLWQPMAARSPSELAKLIRVLETHQDTHGGQR